MWSLHGFLHGHQMDCVSWSLGISFQKPPLGGRPNTKPGDHGNVNAHNQSFILSYHVWEPTWIKIHWTSIWLRTRSHTASHYTWGSMTTLQAFGGFLGRPLDTFFWALTISRSWLLAHIMWYHGDFAINYFLRGKGGGGDLGSRVWGLIMKPCFCKGKGERIVKYNISWRDILKCI
jgi:hypothetical protein